MYLLTTGGPFIPHTPRETSSSMTFSKHFVSFVFRVHYHDLISLAAIVGGLILLVNMGPGGLSVDEKKKTF